MKGRIFATIREAINHTATRCGKSMKEIASELDWSPSTLSLATTLGDENARPFPADDAHLVRLMEVTNDDSVLMTLADKRGYELVVKRDRTPEMIENVRVEFKRLSAVVEQLVLEGTPSSAPRRRAAGASR